jgi:two-component system chemotaxis response regulator CheB
MQKIRVLSIQNRPESVAAIKRSIGQARDIEFVGEAANFPSGLILVKKSKPDIVLAYDDPAIGDFTADLLRIYPDIGIIIIVSGDDPASPESVIAALAKGAFDFVAGIGTKTMINGTEAVSNLLLSKIRCCSIKRYSRMVRGNGNDYVSQRNNPAVQKAAQCGPRKSAQQVRSSKFDAVLIGVSTGGPEALMKVIPALPEKFPVPVLIVMHMPKEFTGPMAAALDRKSRIRVLEVREGEEVTPGKAYLAHGGQHCTVTRTVLGGVQLHTNDDPPENGCKPSVDVLFRSAASVYGSRSLAVVLTGMGNDGVHGCEAVKSQGGIVIVQDESTSVVWGMPGSVVRAGFADEIASITAIPERLCAILGAQ